MRASGTFGHLNALVERAAELGCTELRLTLEWARLERRPGEHDDNALESYVGALVAAKRASMTTVVVLCDAAWPSWLGQEPWLSAWAPQRFAAHAAWLAPHLEGLVRAAVTFRAPNTAAWEGWRHAARPPFRRDATADAVSALDGMLVAHQRAVVALADAAPSVVAAILFDVDRAYGDAALWCDLAGGVLDPVVLGARRARWDELCSRRGLAARRGGGQPLDPSTLRSTASWGSTPPFERWLGGEDLDVLAAGLEHAEGTVPVIELGAGAAGWDAQLAVAIPALTTQHGGVSALHLHGLVASTGPLGAPVGLVEVDQHGGTWTLGALDASLAGRLAALSR